MAQQETYTQTPASVGSVLVWMLAGAVICGGIGWLVATGVDEPPIVGLASGFAAGGGLGAVVRLLVYPTAQNRPETVTVEMDEQARGAEPADLFEAHPDPVCYYSGEEIPTVRAANPAYAETFGVSLSTIENADLDGALMTAETDPFVAAVESGEQFEATVACETPDDDATYLVRVVPTAGESRTDGYVIYTPLATLDEGGTEKHGRDEQGD